MQWSQQHTVVVENIAYCWPCLLSQNQQCAQRRHLWRNPFAVSAVFVAQAPAVCSLRPPVAEHISQCLWLSRRQHHQRTQCQDQWQSTFREAWRHWQPRLQRQHQWQSTILVGYLPVRGVNCSRVCSQKSSGTSSASCRDAGRQDQWRSTFRYFCQYRGASTSSVRSASASGRVHSWGVAPVASSRDVAASLLHTAVAAAERCRGLVNDTGVSRGVRPSESHPHS